MAADESGAERTEEATPRRQEEARKRGQVVRSRDLNMSLSLLAGMVSLLWMASSMAHWAMQLVHANLQLSALELSRPDLLAHHARAALWMLMKILSVPLLVMLLATLAGGIALGGWVFSSEAFMPQWSRIDPWAGLQRMVSLRALLELLKALLKFMLVSTCCLVILRWHRDEIMGLARETAPGVWLHVAHIILWSALTMSASLLLVAAIDAPAQWFSFMRELKMTRQELRDEFKESEGRPEVKMRLRQMQRKMAESRMMAKVAQADVVITNPTHYAVALRYQPGRDAAPILLAKGVDHMALQIRKVADENSVIRVEAPPLARAIYFSTDLDREIPAALYMAVAQVLAWLHGLRRYRAGQGRHPGDVPELEIPQDLRRDV